MHNAPWPEGYTLLIDNVIPLKLEPIALPAKALIDNVGEGGSSAKVLRSYRAVAAVADVRYQSGRVIPSDLQEAALLRALDSKRQMTMYIDHPAPGINCMPAEAPMGRIEHVAGLACVYRYDLQTGQTVLDRIDVLDVPQGRKLLELIDAGVLMGLSQRAIGREEPRKVEINGEEQMVLWVTDLWEIFGWDFLHLDSANAGRITQLEPLSDKALRSLASPGRVYDSDIQEQVAMSLKVKEANEQNAARASQQGAQPLNDNATPTPPPSDGAQKDKELSRLAEENVALKDSIESLARKIEETVEGFKSLNDDFKGRYMTAEAEESLYNRTYTAIRCARSEVYAICHDESLTVTEKNAKLQELLVQMKECFAEISEAYVKVHMKNEDGTSVGAGSCDAMGDKATPATPPGAPSNGASAEVVPLRDKRGVDYVPPQPPAPSPSAQAAETSTKVLESSANLRDSVAALVEVQEKKRALVDLRQYAQSAVERQKLDDEPKKAVLALVDKTIHPHTTKEQIEDAIKASIALVKAGQATERLAGMGLEQPQGVGAMRITDVQDVHALGGSHLEGVKLLTDSLVHTGHFQMAYPEKAKIPPKLQKILDRYDERFAAKLAQEKRFLMDKKEAMGGKALFDASTAADFDTPATISRLVLFETYAADIIREIVDFGTMDNDRDAVPITRWRRDDGAATFRPSVLQRFQAKAAELSPIKSGKLVTEFFNIDAESRKLAAVLSLEFITRSKRRTDITGTAMALQNLVKDIQRSILMDVFYEWIRAAAFHGAAQFTATKDGTGASTYRMLGTNDADTTTIVPNDPRSPLTVKLGTTSSNRTEVPEYGSTTQGGGPSNAYFYTIEHSTSKITFVDANGAALATGSGTGLIEVTGYKASKEKRFDLTLPGSTEQEQHMNRLLFAVSDQRASLSSGGISTEGYYDATSVLASVVTSELMKQAKAYQADGRRNAYQADLGVNEGNYGYTAGLAHWGSKIFPDDFIVIGHRDGVVFRVYEPTHLRGPIEARNSSGQIIGGEEYYAYQEDAMDTPLVQKFSLVTLYRS